MALILAIITKYLAMKEIGVSPIYINMVGGVSNPRQKVYPLRCVSETPSVSHRKNAFPILHITSCYHGISIGTS